MPTPGVPEPPPVQPPAAPAPGEPELRGAPAAPPGPAPFRRRSRLALWLGIVGAALSVLIGAGFYIIGTLVQGGRQAAVPQVFGVVLIALVFVAVAASLTALVLGAMGLSRRNTAHRRTAITGFVLGIVGTCLSGCCVGLVVLGVGAAAAQLAR